MVACVTARDGTRGVPLLRRVRTRYSRCCSGLVAGGSVRSAPLCGGTVLRGSAALGCGAGGGGGGGGGGGAGAGSVRFGAALRGVLRVPSRARRLQALMKCVST